MIGWLITNAFLTTHKFTELNLWLIAAAKKYDIELIVKTNAEILVQLDSECIGAEIALERPNFVLFWDKDIRLAKYLEMKGFTLFNSSNGVAVCDDKSLTHLYLQGAGIHMPKTIIAPMTYTNVGYPNKEFVKTIMNQLAFPMVMKECFGSFGQQVYLVNDEEELLNKLSDIEAKPMLFQEFIKSSSGRDIRLQVVGNQVVAAMYRYSNDGDFRANISIGGKMKPYDPTKEQIELAIRCCKILGLDFAGVDILFGEDEEPIVCEVNSNAHFKNIYDCTGINVAEHIMEYIIKRLCIG